MTTATQTHEVSSSKQVDKSNNAVEKVANHGVTTIADVVVSKIAGIATREVDGVYDLGGQAARVVGKLRETLPGSPSLTQGVSVEVGERQAAIDIGIVADYGIAIHDLAAGIRSNVISSVENMTGLEVTEVNVTVHDVHFADGDDDASEAGEPRVQ
ncbi:Alkaline shock protein 23 [Mycobacteroides salmoniphilum]|uniref:Alkaline shock protein 23 n=1 Tax=Mycobacteroides salmoniphilum TaxID=404941 RepID=A0A4R8RZB9_9MYCO|nr:Asp23/Gls24 family envelope stress response protein [Mycobacteroides salmoniphilum]TDZ79085.1 Alkaline shock protein 23 [Mycobacteroides salmoniphilum]TDZ81171.1 Alkaline shock protein 23 [Mycobacteroides salmoniphilum]TDZ88671.1 Alkaline shock protein 23 [Mycobacteroides salmoniphilum]